MRRPLLHRLPTTCAALGTMVLACHHGGGGPAARTDAEAADSVVGKVQVVGAEPFPRVVLTRAPGTRAITLIGPSSLANVNGLVVAVVGRSTGSQLTVERFTVVEANGVPATDGRLVAEGSILYLETAGGVRHQLVQPSPKLWAHVGSRVWVSGPLDREPVAYGIIE